MACSGKLNVDIEVKSAADKFWECIRDSTTLFPKLFPQQYKSIEVLEGDGKAVGSVRLITYAEGNSAGFHSILIFVVIGRTMHC
uniref:MLP-like protein 423 n=1 Tax=Rhizophora mucronata TaxID=61149 RepID=A0A2P2J769_RHIMU